MAVHCSSPRRAQDELQQNTTCLVGPPIFHTGAQVVFATTLDVPTTAELGDRLQLLAVTRSDNHGPGNESKSQSVELPVKYAIHIIITGGEDSTQYTNFSSKEEEATRTVIHRYEIRNLRQRSPPLWVTFEFPVAVNGVPMWVTAPKLANCYTLPETPGIKDVSEEMKKSPLLGCAVTTCQRVRCNVSAVYMEQPLEFVLTGNISFGWFSQTGRDKVTLVSTAEVGADPGRFHQQGTVWHQVQTVLERVHIYNYVPIIVGSSIGGLLLLALITAALYKFGFFRRQYKEMMESAKEGEGSAPTPGSALGPTPSAPQQ